MIRSYTVYFMIKKNNHGYLNEMTVQAKNQKEAVKLVKEKVYQDSSRNAFRCTFDKPEKKNGGLLFNGMIYPKYTDLFKMLY